MKKLPPVNYEVLVNSAPSLQLVLLPDLTIIEVSESYAKATLTRREEIIGKKLFEVFPDNPDDLTADGVSNLNASLQHVLKNKESHTMAIQRYDIQKPDGAFEKRYWSPFNKPVLDDNREVMYIIHRVEDVTDFVQLQNEQSARDHFTENLITKISDMEIELYKRAQEIQRLNVDLEERIIAQTTSRIQAETDFKEIFEKSTEGIFVQDIDTGEFIEINDRAAELKGCTKEALRTIPREKFVSDDPNYSLEKELEYFRKAVAGEPQSFEWLSRKADGTPTWYKVSMKKATIAGKDRIISFYHEINERKRAEQKILASEQRFRTIIEQFPYPVVNYTPQGDYIFANNAWESMWNDKREALEGYNILQDTILMRSNIGEAIKKGFAGETIITEAFFGDPEIIGKAGRKCWVVFTLFPFRNSDGKIVEIVMIHQDVTEKKNAEEEITKNLLLTKFQKKQLEDFCNIVSHNLRAPLVNISMLVDIMLKSNDMEEIKIFQDKLCRATANLNEIFHHLIESIQIREEVEINKTLHLMEYLVKTTDSLEGQINSAKAMIKSDFSEATVIYYPEKYLLSIFHNLISNALKYSSPDRTPMIKVKTQRNGANVILSVSDNGLGIDLKKHSDNIFKIRKVFHSAPDAKGFGLFITKNQIEAMGDSIRVESIPDQGTTFYIEFKNQQL